MRKRLLAILSLFGIVASLGYAGLPGLQFHRVPEPQLQNRLNLGVPRAIPGGVAFPGIAKSENGETIRSVEYLSDRADGNRLRLQVSDGKGKIHELFPEIFDWQIGPLVKYADDAKYDSLVSYQGIGLHNEGKKKIVGFKFAYHAAIDRQLMGMRLWHADFLLFQPQERKLLDAARVDLPTDDTTNKYILGAGEKAPNVGDNRRRLMAVQKVMEAKKDVEWESYVITDKGRQAYYCVEAGKFVMKGTPIWWFFSTKPGKELQNNESKLTEKDTVFATRDKLLQQLLPGKRFLKSFELKATTDESYIIEMNSTKMDSFLVLEDQDGKMVAFDDDSGGNLNAKIQFSPKIAGTYRIIATTLGENEIGEFSLRVRQVEVTPHLEYSKAITAVIEEHGGINPEVYQATVTAMRYSALFRHIKADLPDPWSRLVKTVSDNTLGMSADTPTLIEVRPPVGADR